MYEIALNGEVRIINSVDEFQAVADELVAKHGGGVPSVKKVDEQSASQPVAVVRPTGWGDVVGKSHVDEKAEARITADMAAMKNAGFAISQPLFAAGTRVVQEGVERAATLRQEFEAKPLVGDALGALQDRIAGEQRQDVIAPASSVRMDNLGRLAVNKDRFGMDEKAFKALVSRLGLPSAGAYLAACWPELRAKNVNNWQLLKVAEEAAARAEALGKGREYEQALINLRTRLNGDRRDVYAVVSDSYAEFDIDKFAQAIKIAMPNDARAEVHYDGQKAKIDVHFHSTVQPEDYAAGEIFRAGISFRTDDTGGGSVKGSSFLEQNLCLNLIITNYAAQPVFSVRHIGDVREMAQKIRKGIRDAEATIAPMMRQWGYARKDDLVAVAVERDRSYEGIGLKEMLAGFFNGAMERELVTVPGRREETIPKLVRAWERDAGTDGPQSGTITRAGFVNALTRYAHEGQSDVWAQDEIQQSASRLLWPEHKLTDRLAEIPFMPM